MEILMRSAKGKENID